MVCDLWAEVAVLGIALLLLISSLIFKNKIQLAKLDFLSMISMLAIVGCMLALNHHNTVDRFYLTDRLSVSVRVLILLIGFCTYMLPTWTRYANKEHHSSYGFIVMMAIFGMNIVAIAKDLMVLYIGLEIMSVAFYALMAIDKNNRFAIDASIKYFISSAFFSGIYIYGVSIVYVNYGSTEMPISLLSSIANGSMLSFGLLMVVSGLLFKMGCVPFHMWTPDVYQGSPMFVTVLLSTASKVAIIAPLIHLIPLLQTAAVMFYSVFKLIAISSIILGSLAALYQSNLKRLVAFSSVAHMGYVVLLIAFLLNQNLGSVNNNYFSVIMLYIFSYIVFTLGFLSFISLSTKSNRDSSDYELSNLEISVQHPLTNVLAVILLMSGVAIPPLSGFFAKFYVLNLVVENSPMLAVFLVIFIVVSSSYYIRIVIIICFAKNLQVNVDNNLILARSSSWWLLLITSLMCLFFVCYGGFLMNLIQPLLR
ncbi:NADH-quinone oxidoreductase subunit N [Candidatus Xenohaliotis californiensis]